MKTGFLRFKEEFTFVKAELTTNKEYFWRVQGVSILIKAEFRSMKTLFLPAKEELREMKAQ